MNHTLLANNIYDLLRLARLPDEQQDDWAELVRRHAQQSMRDIKRNHGRKEFSVSGNTITIGRRITITIQ